MESFGLNSARSFLGRNVNLHLKDGAVIVNVRLTGLRKDSFGKSNFLEYVPFGNHKIAQISLRSIAWAEMVNTSFMQTSHSEFVFVPDKS